MSSETLGVLKGTQKGAMESLKPYLVDNPNALKVLETTMLRCWARGFRMGRQEGRMDVHMFGGEGG